MSDAYSANTALLLHMEGNNNSTTFIDSSGAPKAITRYGDTKISTAQSKWGNGSGYFDGLNDYLQTYMGVISDSTSFTIEVFYYEITGSLNSLMCHRSTSTDGWAITTGGYRGIINGGGFEGNMNWTQPSLNVWHHLAFVRSVNTLYCFVDGIQAATRSVNTMNDAGASTPWTIGSANQLGENYFKGYIQDLRITKDIARYTANFTPPAARLPDPDPATGLIIPSGYRRDIYDGGAYRIIGNVDELGVAGSYRVRLFDRQSARCIRETWSAADGSYAFNHIAYRDQGYFVIAFDHGNNPLNAAIADLITPELMP